VGGKSGSMWLGNQHQRGWEISINVGGKSASM